MTMQRFVMTMYRALLAVSLGLALAACAGEQQTAETAVEAPAAGEIPQAGDQGIVTGSPEENVIETDAGATTADAGAMGEVGVDAAGSAAGTVDPALDPAQQTDPVLEGTTTDQQPATPPQQ
jgi:hypothetical protein